MKLAILALGLAVAGASAVPGWSKVSYPLWPLPSGIDGWGAVDLTVPASFDIVCGSAACSTSPELKASFARTKSNVFVAGKAVPGSLSPLPNLSVVVREAVDLQFGANETYTLNVGASAAELVAQTQWGAIRGLETFSQLIDWTVDAASGGASYTLRNTPVVIRDSPRFPWRGVLLDSSRHFLTVGAIKSTLDAMAYNKYNTLHWHLIDDQSWPLRSDAFPLLAERGAYAPQATYTLAQAAEVVQYARERGIRVVPELDMPAHAAVWGKAYPDLTISCEGGETLLDPTGPVYPVLQTLLSELHSVFPDAYFHLGGDEVWTLKCWNESAKVHAFMQNQSIPDVNALRDYFQTKVQHITAAAGKTTVFWEEVFDKGYALNASTAVNVWLNPDELAKVLKAGQPGINSFGWYLDQQTPPGGTHYLWEDVWRNFYAFDPMPNTTLTPAQQALLLGGEASQWGEQVDATNIHSRMWPRACAAAERLWSPATITDLDDAEGRLCYHRCRMVQRGIGAGPINPSAVHGYCTLPPASPWRP